MGHVESMARPFHHPALKDVEIDSVLHALADPERRNILAKLIASSGLSCAGACGGLPPSTISHHHKVLRDAGLIRSEKKGVEVINTARKAEVDKRFPGLLDTVLRHHKPLSPRA